MEEMLKKMTAKLEELNAKYLEALISGNGNLAEAVEEETAQYRRVCRDVIYEMNRFKAYHNEEQ